MKDRGTRAGASVACALFALLPAAHALQTKKPVEPPPAVDPYTRNEPALLERLGYRGFGPMRFGATTSEEVQSRLGDVPMLWVETEHFRIGSSLEEYKPEKQAEIKELERELGELRTLLERVPTKPKKLDPWLRLHLTARRMERLHADLDARLGLGALAQKAGKPAKPMQYSVLVTQKKSTLARFTREFCGGEHPDGHFHYFPDPASLFFGLSDETVALSDSDLHYALVFNVSQNILRGVHGRPLDLPAWWAQGLALWFARASEPRVQLYSRPAGEMLPPDELADWQPLVRGRVEGGGCLAWDEMLARPSWLDQPFGDNVVLWSRIDYLMQLEGVPVRLAELLHHPSGKAPDGAMALGVVTGLGLAELDAAWREWVLETYRKKRK